MMLPVMDYMMEEEQVRDLEYKLDLNNRGIPTGACWGPDQLVLTVGNDSAMNSGNAQAGV